MTTSKILLKENREDIGFLQKFSQKSIQNALFLAKNPQTPPTVLSFLGKSHKKDLQKLVVKNPNTPRHILFELAAFFPGEFLENPIFSLLIVEDPNFLYKLPAKAIRKLFTRKTLPVLLLELAAKDSLAWIRAEAAKHPQLSIPLLKILQNDRDPGVRRYAKNNLVEKRSVPSM